MTRKRSSKKRGNSKKFYKRMSYYRRRYGKSNPRIPRKTKKKTYKKQEVNNINVFFFEHDK